MSQASKAAADTTWVFKQFLYEDVLRDLDDHFQRLNIDYMPIKGAYLICAGLAQRIRSRTMVDIDILVREGDFNAVISHFSTIPNAAVLKKSWPLYKKGWPFEVAFYYSFRGQTINVDIHKLLNFRQRFLLPPEMLFMRGTKQGHRTLPCAEDALAICLCHGFSHIGQVFSDALFDDVALLANASIDWAKFGEIAVSTGAAAFMYHILRNYEKKVKIPPIRVFKKTLKFTYADILFMLAGTHELGFLPAILRRLFVEIPLCRDPVGLILDKCKRVCLGPA